MLAVHLLRFLLLRIKGDLFGQTQGLPLRWVLAIQRRNYRPFYALYSPFIPFKPFLLRHALEILLDVGIGELVVLQVAVEVLLVGGHVDETVT